MENSGKIQERWGPFPGVVDPGHKSLGPYEVRTHPLQSSMYPASGGFVEDTLHHIEG